MLGFSQTTTVQFIGCNKGLSGIPNLLYHDTVIDKLIVYGNYDLADGMNVHGIATWDGTKFDSLGTGAMKPYGGHKEVLIHYKNKLYGMFNDLYMHAYDYSTKQWQKIPGQFDAFIRDATVFNNELIIVGDFQKVGNLTVRNIIKFDGANYDTLPRPVFSSWMSCVEVYKNELYVGGNFDPMPFQAIAKFDGTKWVSATPNLYIDALEAWDFEIYNNKLFVCGKWDSVNHVSMPSIASWDGVQWKGLGKGLTFSGLFSGAPAGFKKVNNLLYVFGSFDTADTVHVRNMAVWNDTIWCATTPTLNFQPSTVEYYKGKWYMGGVQIFYYTDTVNYLGVYIGNKGKLEGNCFDKPIKAVESPPPGIYPNPFNSIISLRLKEDLGETCSLKIINQLGQSVAAFENISTSTDLDLSQYPVGVYLLLFTNPSGHKAFKILKDSE